MVPDFLRCRTAEVVQVVGGASVRPQGQIRSLGEMRACASRARRSAVAAL